MSNLAAAYWSAKRLDRSIPMFEELLKLNERKLGRKHTSTVQAIANLGVNYRDAGRLTEALPLLKEAYRASRTIPALAWSGGELLAAYEKAGRTADADALIKELVDVDRLSNPKESPGLAHKLASYGIRLVRMKAFAQAEPLLRESLAITARAEPDAWTTFNRQSVLGGALLGQNKLGEAEALLRQGYDGLSARAKSIPPESAARIPKALDRLIELYTAGNKPEEVKKWRVERARYDKSAGLQSDTKK